MGLAFEPGGVAALVEFVVGEVGDVGEEVCLDGGAGVGVLFALD